MCYRGADKVSDTGMFSCPSRALLTRPQDCDSAEVVCLAPIVTDNQPCYHQCNKVAASRMAHLTRDNPGELYFNFPTGHFLTQHRSVHCPVRTVTLTDSSGRISSYATPRFTVTVRPDKQTHCSLCRMAVTADLY
ncbi:hypothetical protein RRG08_060014 [Elysia crispata]|uniref:Uncharacterized protein n=1 Tax=Elysia crispata TaxID=231223 RepID=A0AAE1CXP5_9GAST|nr:hypothetical protein RRG08_060014 [Elysia crispata]